jgi:hypothetical protein
MKTRDVLEHSEAEHSKSKHSEAQQGKAEQSEAKQSTYRTSSADILVMYPIPISDRGCELG